MGKLRGSLRHFMRASWVQWSINSCVRYGQRCTFKRSDVGSIKYVESPLIEITED